jgi:hypothetical protein
MAVEPFDFSCAVVLPNGTAADIQQTDIQRGKLRDITFFVAVRPHAGRIVYTGALHLSSASLSNLDACPGDTRAEKSQWVAEALRAWVKEHGLDPDFTLDLAVAVGNDQPCAVSILPVDV